MDSGSILSASTAGRNAAKSIEPRSLSGLDVAAAARVAEEFEAQFLGQMFQMAMDEMPVDEVFGGGPGEKMFRGMLTNEWADKASKAGGVGISDAVMTHILRIQEGANT